jgi:hypothetical protein
MIFLQEEYSAFVINKHKEKLGGFFKLGKDNVAETS